MSFPATEIERLRDLYRHIYSGPSWHGPYWLQVLDRIQNEHVNLRVKKEGFSPAEILKHALLWRGFMIRKIEGDAAKATEEDWLEMKESLKASQDIILAFLETFQEEDLSSTVAGNEKLPWYELLHGVIHHDVYHLGQMLVVLKSCSDFSLN
jgi:uncharacterized damage-inducible protein DinB